MNGSWMEELEVRTFHDVNKQVELLKNLTQTSACPPFYILLEKVENDTTKQQCHRYRNNHSNVSPFTCISSGLFTRINQMIKF